MKSILKCLVALAALLTLALAASLTANAYLLNLSQQYYHDSQATKLDPYGLDTDWPPVEPLPPGQHRAVLFGDSRAWFWRALPDSDGFQFVNRGIGGQTSAQIAGRFAAHVAPLHPDVVIVQVCINDLTVIPAFSYLRDDIIADCVANTESVVRQATALDASVILTTVFPISAPSIERQLWFWSDDVESSILAVNERLRALAGDDVLLLDAYSLLVGTDGRTRPDYARDTLHLNRAGYAALNEALSGLLESLSDA